MDKISLLRQRSSRPHMHGYQPNGAMDPSDTPPSDGMDQCYRIDPDKLAGAVSASGQSESVLCHSESALTGAPANC